MKKLLLLFLIPLFVCCGTSKKAYLYFFKESSTPQLVVDSLASSYRLELPSYKDWVYHQYMEKSTMQIVTLYNTYGTRNDTTFIFNVLDYKEPVYDVRMTLEYKQVKK